MDITFYGQSCFSLEFGGKKLLFDPFIRENPLAKAAEVDIDAIQADYILLSHAHGDHVADADYIAKQTGATIISNYEIVTHYQALGHKGHPMNHGGKWKFDFGTVKYVNAVHTSSFHDGSNGGNPGGFVIWNDDYCVYFAGDTALTMDMKLIPRTCPSLDVAILPIGDNFTMGYEDASIAAEYINCDSIIGCHYDTFGFIEIDHQAAKDTFSSMGKDLILLDVGKTITLKKQA